jgi:hypothetical protein
MAELVLASHKGAALNLCGEQFILLTNAFKNLLLKTAAIYPTGLKLA